MANTRFKKIVQSIEHIGPCRGRCASVSLLIALAGIFVLVALSPALGREAKATIPKGQQTTLGLYVTAAEAYEMWKTAPNNVKVVDVRTPEEYALIGHPEKAWNVPFAFVTYQRKDGKTAYGPKMNPDFLAEVTRIPRRNDTLLLMCRSGDRRAMAVNKLAVAGFKNAYSIIDGFEGDKVTDRESVFYGKRLRDG